MCEYSGRFWSFSVETTSSCDVEPATPAVELTGSEIVSLYSVLLKACKDIVARILLQVCVRLLLALIKTVKYKLSFWLQERQQ